MNRNTTSVQIGCGHPWTIDEADVPALQNFLETLEKKYRTDFKIGRRVRVKQDVEKYPCFIVRQGAVGTVTDHEGHIIWVQMDEHVVGCEEWNNQVSFDEHFPPVEYLEVIP